MQLEDTEYTREQEKHRSRGSGVMVNCAYDQIQFLCLDVVSIEDEYCLMNITQ